MTDLKNTNLNFKHYFIYLSLSILLTVAGSLPLKAQTKKDTLSFDAVRQWRTHSVTLSDNGAWYTTLYSLFDDLDAKKDTTDENSIEQKIKTYYQTNNETEVLHIFHAEEGLKYEIPKGSRPVFSDASDWIAYQITSEEEEETTFIELKHLESGFTVQYESNASFRFLEDKNYFVTTDKSSLLIYDLKHRSEHYIGNIGEYLVDKKSDYIVYTIASEDQRGNGIYRYDPDKMTTRALQTGRFTYSNLAWNDNKTALAAYKYTKTGATIDDKEGSILILNGINGEAIEAVEYPVKDMEGVPENMGLAMNTETYTNQLRWSKDDERLFLKIKAYNEAEEKQTSIDEDGQKGSSVQVWHWKDKKLLSERMLDSQNKENEVFEAIFFRNENKLMQLTSEAMQQLYTSLETDNWAIGTDNRAYLSDWDINKNDLYRINLKTGDKKLIEQKYPSRYSSGLELSPDGKKAILWDGAHFWCYDFATDNKRNISERVGVSFIRKEYDLFGYTPNYGFVGWVKDQNAIIVNHKLDLWLLPIDGRGKAQNLTESVTKKDSIRFRFEEYGFARKSDLEDRYIDLSQPNFLYAFHIKTKHAGFYNLQKGRLKQLIFEPATFAGPWSRSSIVQSEDSDAIIYTKGDYRHYPEAYLSPSDFSKPKQITHTNPQQELFKWGRRILIDYTNDDGVPLQGILSIPESYQAGQKLPMLVYSYEKLSYGRYSYAMPYLNGATAPEMLYVSEGYLYLRPDIHFNVGTPHSDMYECIDAAVEKVIELGYVDEEKIGYEGFSFGGHCGMYMSTQDNKFAAIAAGAGVSNLVQGFNIDIVRDGSNEQDYYMVGQGRLGTDPTSNTEMYISESPVFNAANMNTPLLLFHGTADKVVQWEHSFGFYSILRYLKKPVVFLSYIGEGHGFRKENNRLDIQMRMKDYFDHYLRGKPAKKWMTEELPLIAIDKKNGAKWK